MINQTKQTMKTEDFAYLLMGVFERCMCEPHKHNTALGGQCFWKRTCSCSCPVSISMLLLVRENSIIIGFIYYFLFRGFKYINSLYILK